MKRGVLFLALSLCLSAVPETIRAGDDGYRWLERMGAAMSQMSYQGTFVYMQGDNVESMRITHLVDSQGVHERMVSVSGSPDEVVRDADGVRWISGENRTVMADTSARQGVFPQLPLGDSLRESDFYELKLGGNKRIAGHNGSRLSIVAKDEFRYGYNLWQETHSGLLLRWEMTDSDGRVLAKLMFTELKMGSQVDSNELTVAAHSNSLMPGKTSAETARYTIQLVPKWKPVKLPRGFRLASHHLQKTGDNTSLEHMVYSDGIAAVSVYVDSGQGKFDQETGLSRLGTTHFFTRMEGDEHITVLGDVPAVTVKMIGESLSLSHP